MSESKLDPGLESSMASSDADEERDVLVLLDESAGGTTLGDAGASSADDPSLSQSRAQTGAKSSGALVQNEADITRGVQTRELLYAALAKRLLAALPEGQVELRTQYQHIPMLLLHVQNEDALLGLLDHAEVARVYEDRMNEAFLAESLPLIHQPTVAAAGNTGQGTAVAVLDTGCDYTRAAFGSCSAPGASGCKVAFARDFAPDDGSRDDVGHGTNVSGIVVGVAPSTKVLALDVFRSGGATSSDILSAVDWVIAQRTTYNIVAMNMSLGSGSFTAACPNDVFAAGLANARAAGIVPVVASGNSGTTNAIASPACVPAAVSVGAVYDANVGGLGFSNCSDPTTAADRVTCFSNSASFLSLLAPGAMITAAGITQAGTSQAAPHVAGALAVVRAACASEGVDAAVNRLTSNGPTITDSRNGVAKHRLDLAAALNAGAPDSSPPTGTVVISSGSYSKSTAVTLTLTASDNSGVTPTMCISNTTTCTTFSAFASSKSWTLTTGNGEKTVRVTLKDGAGNLTVLSATTTLDTTLPVDGTLSATPSDASVALSWSGYSDANSGLASYRVVYAATTAPVSCSAGTLVYSGTETSFAHAPVANGSSYAYRVCAVDFAGNISAGKTLVARPAPEFDAPLGTVSINGDASVTKSGSVTLTLSATDASTVSTMCLSNISTCSTWVPFATSKAFTLTTGDGTRSVYAWFRDNWGNTSASPVTDSILVDATAPSDGSATATPTDKTLTIGWSGFADTGSGIASYKLVFAASTSPASCSTGSVLYTGTDTTFTHTPLTNGSTYGYRLCALDRAGNTSAGRAFTGRPVPETDAPVGSVTINAGSEYARSLTLTLSLAATDASAITAMCISQTATCTTWQPYAAAQNLNLASGEGSRTVYAWFRDAWGNTMASPVSDRIFVDTILPKEGRLTATASDGAAALTWSGFSDAGSGLAEYRLVVAERTAPANCNTGTVLYSGGTDTSFSHTGLTNGTTYAYRLCAVDRAGNTTAGQVLSARPIPETDAPVGSISIADGATYTKSASVTVTLSASDGSGVASVCLSTTTSCANFVSMAATKTFTLATGDGVRNAYAWFRDTWGNTSRTPVSDSVILDTTLPTDGTATGSFGDASVTLSWSGCSDSGSGIAGYRVVSAQGTAPTSCASGTVVYNDAAPTFSQTGLINGVTYGYRVCAVDRAGNVSFGKAISLRPVPELDAPTGAVVINDGAAYTKSSSVTLALSATDASAVTSMCISTSTTCSSWSPFAANPTLSLATGEGVRTVYVRFRDEWGNTSTLAADAITVDVTPPANGSVTATPGDSSVTLAFSGFTDARSGVGDSVVVFAPTTPPANCSTGTLLYRGRDSSYVHSGLTSGTAYGYRVCAFDNAGNLSAGKTAIARPTP